ncbi:MAG TPA: hypothetical protein PK263_01995 [bacterium]|nr:hypothetical protein [bacterium]
MLNEAVEEAGLNRVSAQKLLGKGGELKDGIGALVTRLTAPDLLEFVTAIELPAIETFSASDHFQVGTVDGVTIGWIGDNFRQAFLGKTETCVVSATLRVQRLIKASVDAPIIAELGEAQVETSLAHLWELLKLQGHGQKGVLLTNGWAYIFYIKDAAGVLWAVYCDWDSVAGYWSVEAYPVAYPYRWDDGHWVVSR